MELRERLEADLCDFERSRPNTVISHVDNRGGIVQGDIISRAEVHYERVASVLAVTKGNVILTRNDGYGYCCQWVAPGYFYCGYQYCKEVTEHSLRQAFGLGRAPDMGQARELAIENCEASAEQLAEEIGISKYRSAFKCRVLRSEWCN